MQKTIHFIAALYAAFLGCQTESQAQGPSPFGQDPSARKGTQHNPYSVLELVALASPPAQAWAHGQIRTVEASIASDPLDIDVTFSNNLKVRVNVSKLHPIPGYQTNRHPLKAVSVTDGVEIINSQKPGPPVFSFNKGGYILVGLNVKRPISTGIVAHYQRPRNSRNEMDGLLGIPR